MTYLLTDEQAAKVRDALLNELCYLQICDAHEKSLTMNKEAIAILDNAQRVEVSTWAGDLQGTDASFLTSARAAHEEPT